MNSDISSLPSVQSLQEVVRELSGPLETIQGVMREEEGADLSSATDLIVGELMMVALIFTNADFNISHAETDMLNRLHRAIGGDVAWPLTSTDYQEMCRQFLHIHPDGHLSIDRTPLTVQRLQIYDSDHGTAYAEKARTTFFQLADQIVKADGTEKAQEMMALQNFKEILYQDQN